MNDSHKDDALLPQVYRSRSIGQVIFRIKNKVVGLYNPQPMAKPEVDKDIDKMGALEQIHETICYSWDSIVYAISPEGGLQAWWKMMFRLTLFCLPVGILFVLATFMLAWGTGYLEAATKAIQHAVESIGLTVLYAVAIAFFISSVVIFAKSRYFSHLGWVSGLVFLFFLVIAIIKMLPAMVSTIITGTLKNLWQWISSIT
jgi:cation transport ATPase